MDSLGYISLSDAEALTGISASVLETRCQAGKLRWAVKHDGTWYVPRSELVKVPDPGRDVILNDMVYATRRGFEFPVTLVVHGAVLSGVLTSVTTFIHKTRDDMYADLERMAKSAKLGAKRLRLVADTVLKGQAHIEQSYEDLFENIDTDPVFYDYCYLRDVQIEADGSSKSLGDRVLRIRLSSVDGYGYGQDRPKRKPA